MALMTKKELENYFDFCISKIDGCIDDFTYKFPDSSSVNGVYPPIDNIEWTNGFWTGMLWLAYEMTGKEKYKQVAMLHVENFDRRIKNKIEVDHHDMGFLYTLSCMAAYKITGDETAKNAALAAANNLCERYVEKGRFIKAWGDMNDMSQNRLIIDCLLNIPLLYWAHEVTGNENYYNISVNHLNTTIAKAIREDWTTYHTYFFDKDTGEALRGETAQGYSDSSIWARGQAWCLYGLALSYRYTKQANLIEKQKMITEKFIEKLPTDNVPCWDMIFTDTKTQKDTSASPIAVCGMLEMNELLNNKNTPWVEKAHEMIRALGDNYTTKDNPQSNGILAHAVYSIPHNRGIDECNIWGDYFYMEALVRMLKPDWKGYW